MASDTHNAPGSLRPAQVDHACGHRFTHLVPAILDEDVELLSTLEVLALHPCPSCMAGVTDWAVGAHQNKSTGSEAGTC
ncbi:MAG: hypothetical protein Q8S43_01460 [Actinomycetota bacterium]|nr:MAG: hypothetical protein FD171_978 [Actinomycetota bacterium]MDO8949214.1 hypothetical protein [Actinomycetota bacterium]MDP3629608.1 hypothetical protein [Actinomycetota bacterium]